jgi:hypothetical protein
VPVRTEAMVAASTASTITVYFHFVGQDGDGRSEQFRNVRVFDSFGRPVPIPSPGVCVYFFDAVSGPIPRDALPVFVEADGCEGAADTARGYPLFGKFRTVPGAPGPGVPCSALMCPDNPACDEAVSAAMRIQNNMAMVCARRARLRDRADEREREGAVLLAVGIALLLLGLVLIGLSFWVNALIGGILMAVAIGLMSAASGAFAEANDLRRLQRVEEEAIDRLRAQWQVAMDTVGRQCCPGCVNVPLMEPC